MSTIEHIEPDVAPPPLASARPRRRLRRIGAMVLMAFIAQYVLIALLVGLSLAATLHYWVTPQIVATFEALNAALRH
jgi:hypothetical protein